MECFWFWIIAAKVLQRSPVSTCPQLTWVVSSSPRGACVHRPLWAVDLQSCLCLDTGHRTDAGSSRWTCHMSTEGRQNTLGGTKRDILRGKSWTKSSEIFDYNDSYRQNQELTLIDLSFYAKRKTKYVQRTCVYIKSPSHWLMIETMFESCCSGLNAL